MVSPWRRLARGLLAATLARRRDGVPPECRALVWRSWRDGLTTPGAPALVPARIALDAGP